MNHHYDDIRSRIVAPPIWWDENAVPRYCDFGPREGANIYAVEVALVEIACQNCRARFLVAFSRGSVNRRELMATPKGEPYKHRSLADEIRDGSLHYGDPPNTGCCPAGPTMNCDDLRVVEFWKQKGFGWERDPSLEVSLEPTSPQSAVPPLSIDRPGGREETE